MLLNQSAVRPVMAHVFSTLAGAVVGLQIYVIHILNIVFANVVLRHMRGLRLAAIRYSAPAARVVKLVLKLSITHLPSDMNVVVRLPQSYHAMGEEHLEDSPC